MCGLVVPARSDAASCARHGTRWRVKLGTRSAAVGDIVGMLHLAVLIANRGTEILAIDLVAGLDAVTGASRPAAGSPHQVLDQVAVSQYRKRLSLLSEQAEDLESDGDREGASRARAERNWLLRELAAGIKPACRRRSIRRALTSVEHADAAIGAHLRATVHTGTRCWYRPL